MKWNGGVHFDWGEDGCVGCWGGGRGLGEAAGEGLWVERGRRGNRGGVGVVGGELGN